MCCEYTRRKGFILDDYKIIADNVKFILSNASEFKEIVTYLPRNCRVLTFLLHLHIQRPMQTEKRITYNNPVSVKTSNAEIYYIETNNISRLVKGGFFYAHNR